MTKFYNADEVRDCYDRTAEEYAAQFLNELDGKPFDRNLLERFSALLPEGGRVYDFGCGSGQTTKYLHDRGRQTVIGLDFSEAAIRLAQQHFPEIEFGVDDMLASRMASDSADGILAFYAIVHFTEVEVEQALKEWLRLLKPGGLGLFSFHIGEGSLPVTDFLGVPGANATWHYLDMDRALELAEQVGFEVTEAVIRYPYKDQEYASKRAYVMVRKKRVE
jgi:SAM-dependent methyltransferase